MIQAIESRRETVAGLCRQFHVERLDVFGSAASDAFDEEASDLDFLVEFRRVESMSPADQYFGLLSELQKLFGRDVDLLTRQSLRNPYTSSARSRRRVGCSMRPESPKHLEDVRDAAAFVLEVTAGTNLGQYLENRWGAVEAQNDRSHRPPSSRFGG